MAAYRSPNVNAALHLVQRMNETLKGRMKPGGPVHSTYTQAQRLAASVDSLEELARTRSPSETPEAHTLRVANAAKRLKDQIAATSQTVNDNTVATYRNLYAKLDEATNLSRETPHAAEIRAYFRGLSHEQRLEHINRAVKQRDSDTLAALMHGPDYLSGIDKSMRDRFVQAYQEEVAPDLVQEIKAFEEADSAAQEVLRITRKAVDQAFDPNYVAEILESEAKAQATRERLDASIRDFSAPPPDAAA